MAQVQTEVEPEAEVEAAADDLTSDRCVACTCPQQQRKMRDRNSENKTENDTQLN